MQYSSLILLFVVSSLYNFSVSLSSLSLSFHFCVGGSGRRFGISTTENPTSVAENSDCTKEEQGEDRQTDRQRLVIIIEIDHQHHYYYYYYYIIVNQSVYKSNILFNNNWLYAKRRWRKKRGWLTCSVGKNERVRRNRRTRRRIRRNNTRYHHFIYHHHHHLFII